MKRSLLLTAAFLAACSSASNLSVPDDAIGLHWQLGDEFYVGATYLAVANKTEETAVSLEGSSTLGAHDDNWSSEIVWSFQTVEAELIPDASDELYPYAVREDETIAPLTVLRAYVDSSLNDDGELLESDPVIYMVFRADRDRLAAIISFANVNGERVQQAFSTSELGRSYSTLSQSMITAAPTYLAPFSAGFRDESKVLENGSVMESFLADDGVVDVSYEDELGGGVVVSRYEAGAPWPTYTDAGDVRSRLLNADDVAARRISRVPNPPPDYDFRAALASSVSLDRSLRLDEATVAGGWEGGAPSGYRPWAGSWWPQSKGDLIFSQHSGSGWNNTVSDAIKTTIDPLKRELDALSEEIRGLQRGSAEYNTKADTYRAKQSELSAQLNTYYDGVLQDLNGGAMVVADGKVTHTAHGADGAHATDFSYKLNELSPLDKYALQMWSEGNTSPNPWSAPAWEILNHYSPGGGSWWGHCNGWSAAAILTSEPRESVTTQVRGAEMVWTTGDIKGLMTESHYSTYSRFYGQRYNSDTEDIADLSPKHFHQIIQFYLREQQVPFVFDITADAPVWNYPAFWADVSVTETTPGGGAGLINVNTATLTELQTLPGIGPSYAKRILQYRENHGPFQTVEELAEVDGIGSATVAELSPLVTVRVNGNERTFSVSAAISFTTDAVHEEHLDSNADDPEGFVETYAYTLTTDAKGVVTGGTWADVNHHPDFAWVPYSNPSGFSSGSSENAYLAYSHLERVLGDFNRK